MALSDSMARSAAAQAMMGMAGGGGGAPPPDAGVLDEAPMEAPPAAPDLDSALAGVEASLEGMDPAIAGKIRDHLNAIREIASQDEGESQDNASEENAESGKGVEDNSVPSSGLEGAPSMPQLPPGM